MELREKIIEDLRKTGFISELKVGEQIKKNGKWSIDYGSTFEDKDSGKSREVDIIATYCKYDKETKIHYEFSLIIDVKKSQKHPWVIFCTDKNSWNNTQGWRILHACMNQFNKK